MISKKFERRLNNSMYRIVKHNDNTTKFKKLVNVLFKQQTELRDTHLKIKKLSNKFEFKTNLNLINNKRIRFLENMIKFYQFLLIVLLVDFLIVVLHK